MNNDQTPFAPQDHHDDGLLLPPWERRDRFGFLNGLYLTVKDVLFAPGRFFHRMPSQVGILQPLLFSLVLGALGTLIVWLYSLVASSIQMLVPGGLELSDSLDQFFLFLCSPLLVTVGVFFQAALTHVMMLMLGGNRLGFEATFRVVAYSEATSILLLVPICGSALALIWSLIVLIVGLYNIHETAPWKAVVAVLAPMLLCFAVIGGIGLLFAAAFGDGGLF